MNYLIINYSYKLIRNIEDDINPQAGPRDALFTTQEYAIKLKDFV